MDLYFLAAKIRYWDKKTNKIKNKKKQLLLKPKSDWWDFGQKGNCDSSILLLASFDTKADCSFYLTHPVCTIVPALLFIVDSVFCCKVSCSALFQILMQNCLRSACFAFWWQRWCHPHRGDQWGVTEVTKGWCPSLSVSRWRRLKRLTSGFTGEFADRLERNIIVLIVQLWPFKISLILLNYSLHWTISSSTVSIILFNRWNWSTIISMLKPVRWLSGL